MNRRDVLHGAYALSLAGLGASLPLVGRASNSQLTGKSLDEIDSFIRQKMERDHVPGVAACLVHNQEIIWSAAYGQADLERERPMSLDSIQNIASISKTVTTTAVMQLEELGLVDLDDPVGEYCSFPVRHPRAPGEAISLRQLLTHRSAIADGPAYSKFYRCGDPRLELEPWLREYFTPSGRYYDEARNFHAWTPGDGKYEYCNLSYGLLGHVVAVVSGIPFAEYCRLNIFAPLDMQSTSWRIADIDEERHVVPYTWIADGVARGPDWGGTPLGAIRRDGPSLETSRRSGFEPNCVYGHPNYPDGFLRTTVADLSRYLRAYLGRGAFAGFRLLEGGTVEQMLSPDFEHDPKLDNGTTSRRSQGLTWSASTMIGGELAWGHSGSDPGVNTDLRMLPRAGLGAIAFTNTNGASPWEITAKLLELSAREPA